MDHPEGTEPTTPGLECRHNHPERGASVVEWAGLGAVSIAVILVLGAALEVAGLNIINWIQDQLIS